MANRYVIKFTGHIRPEMVGVNGLPATVTEWATAEVENTAELNKKVMDFGFMNIRLQGMLVPQGGVTTDDNVLKTYYPIHLMTHISSEVLPLVGEVIGEKNGRAVDLKTGKDSKVQ